MIPYILKSSACLLVFMLFYTFFLEKESVHTFKRFYLLAAILLAFGIPLITFTEFIEPVMNFGFFDPNSSLTPPYFPAEIPIEEKTNYLPIILWSIYGIGAFLFGIKFIYNLSGIYTRIRKNPKQKSEVFTNVLLKDLIMPHTFFNYIFLNKQKFETQQIPKEVFWHEQTHANQKHSIDVLLIEILQVIFWFNPLIYITKRSIKLNHEFLADQAVINKGIQASNYQEILLAFSSNAQHVELANAINYSSIKKRFTIMNTHTSKQKLWLRSILLLPLLAILIYSFSSTKLVEKTIEKTATTTNNKTITKDILIFIRNSGELVVNNKVTNSKNLIDRLNDLNKNLSYDERKQKVSAYVFIEPNTGINVINQVKQTLKVYGVKIIETEETNLPESLKSFTPGIGTPVLEISLNPMRLIINGKPSSLENLEANFNTATLGKRSNIILESEDIIPKQIIDLLWEKLGENILSIITPIPGVKVTGGNFPTINDIACDNCTVNLSKEDIEKLILGTTTNQNINSFKIKFPEKPTLSIQGNQLNKKAIDYIESAKISDAIIIFNIVANKELLKSHIKILFATKQPKSLSKEQILEYNTLVKHYNTMPKDNMIIKIKDMKRVRELYDMMSDKQKKKAEAYPSFPPPPPPPTKNPTEEYKKMAEKAQKGEAYSYEYKNKDGKTVKVLVENRNGKTADPKVVKGVSTQTNLPTINGIECDECTVNLSREGIKKLIVGNTNNQTINSFKIKFPKQPTQTILGNQLNKQAISYLKDAKIGNTIIIFYIVANKKLLESHINIQLVIKHDKNYSHSPIVKKGVISDIPPPPPPAPKVIKGELSDIPPPPPPMSPLDHVIHMAKKDATFYLEGKKISSDEAIDALNKNKKLNIQTIDSKVFITKKPILIGEKGKNKKVIEEYTKAHPESVSIQTSKTGEKLEVVEVPSDLLDSETPKTAYDFVMSLKNDDITYYYNGKKTSHNDILEITKKETRINVKTNIENHKGTVHFTSVK